MWLLLLVVFSGPMEIERITILEHLSSRMECVKRVNEAVKVGLPNNTNIGCVEVKHLSKISGG